MLKNIVLNLGEKIDWNHHPNIPSSFRALLIGSSGCGKTTLLLQMLLTPNFLDFNSLYIFTSTPQQDEYQLLYHGFKNGLSKESLASILLNQKEFKGVPIPTLIKNYANLHKSMYPISVVLTDNTDNLTPPDQLDKTKKNLIIFDDCVSQRNQKILESFFNRGRHNSCNCIYLSQSYFDLNRMIRLNSNILILFKLSPRNKVELYNSIAGNIMDRNDFNSYVNNVWSKKYSYVVIDKDRQRIFSDIFSEVESDSEDDES